MRRAYLVVDCGSNWLGDKALAMEYVDELASIGVDAVKVQLFQPDQVYRPDELASLRSKYKYTGFDRMCMGFDTAVEIRDRAKSAGIDWFASVFAPEDILRLVKLGPRFIKIAARNAAHLGMIGIASDQDVPTVISMSAQHRTLQKRGDYLEFFKSRKKYRLVWCVSKYPATPSDISLAAIRAYDGFSDHTLSTAVPIAAASAWLESAPNGPWEDFYLEVHAIADDQNRDLSPDGMCSKTFSQIKDIVRGLRDVEALR